MNRMTLAKLKTGVFLHPLIENTIALQLEFAVAHAFPSLLYFLFLLSSSPGSLSANSRNVLASLPSASS